MKKIIQFFRHLAHEMIVNFSPKWLRNRMLSCQQVTEIINRDDAIPLQTKIKMHHTCYPATT